jgi:hypothetical protein
MAERLQGQTEEQKYKRSKTTVGSAVPETGTGESGSTTMVLSSSVHGTVRMTRVTGEAGAAGLRLLAGVAFRRKGVRVATNLLNEVLQGDMESARILIGILNPGKGEKTTEKQPRGRSLAEIWAAEPRWEESSEETAEVGAGGREPE